ncbi:Beta-glucuronosyltransferase GlcAT14A [Glycine soja]|nr:Xylosyltransferase 1 [Glycine soja]
MGAERKWLFTLLSAAFLSLMLLLMSSFSAFSTPKVFPSLVQHGSHYPPAFAYFISGGNQDKDRILRLLLAVYHPRNRYLLHLGRDARDEERQALAAAVRAVPVIRAFGNVDVVGKADYVTYLGSSNVAIILRAAAIMLKLDSGWNWFITLSARDYPLITQDDLSHVFSSVRRDLNFIDHTGDLGWKESDRFQPIVVDPGLYLARKSSPWLILSRPFLEFCIFGWDNLPRTLLMYFTNVKLSQEGYFHSVVCNAPEFKNTTVNGDLRYMIWDNPPKMEPHFLNASVYNQMAESGAAFARQFQLNNPVLDMIDERILQRGRHRVTPGAWCTGRRSWWVDPCSQWGDVNTVKPGPRAKKLEGSVSNLLDDWNSQTNQCK